jgi:serine/threonine protein kinase
MEHLEGRNLEQVIREEGPASSERVLLITRQLLDALEQAHDKRILHRDIKPENIILLGRDAQGNESAKLVDFGLAKPQQSLRDSSDTGEGGVTLVKTRGGGFLGTPRYTAPEQAVGDPLGPYTDLFTLGLVVAEWLTGKLRLTGSTHAELMTLLLGPDPINIEDCPPVWRPWLRKMLEKQPEQRFQSSRQAIEELGRMVERNLHSTRVSEFEFDLEHGALIEATSSSSSSSSFLDDSGPLELDRDATHATSIPITAIPAMLPERSAPSMRAPMLSPPPSSAPGHNTASRIITGPIPALPQHGHPPQETHTSALTIVTAALVSCIVFLLLIAVLGSAFKLF